MILHKISRLNVLGFNDSLGRPERKNTQSKGDHGGPTKYPPMIKLVLLWKIKFQI